MRSYMDEIWRQWQQIEGCPRRVAAVQWIEEISEDRDAWTTISPAAGLIEQLTIRTYLFLSKWQSNSSTSW